MMNRTMKLLMLSDIFVLTGFGLIQPILAIFINQGVAGGTVLTAGLASTIFLLTKSLVQLPFAKYIDDHGKKTQWLILGTLLMAFVPILYVTADSMYKIYLAELIYGLGSGLAYPTWLGLWTSNLNQGKESFQWSIYSTSTSIGTAAAGTIGAAMANIAGFTTAFLLAGVMCLFGCVTLLVLESRSSQKVGGHKKAEAHFRRSLRVFSSLEGLLKL
jgi:DHA1 family quinolone resistance protein-like MFS transporter